ncbi:MAG: twin-arginine translocase TatA/TatE family subunit [Bdellovibrionales bacterium]|nr:twin-arginine translocase TatA/TatE family subunit [Bdellovibrionales bacterium]
MYPSLWQILIILGIFLLLFGHKRIREFGKSLGEALRDFKKGLEEKPDTPENNQTLSSKENGTNPQESSSSPNEKTE